MGNGFSRPNRWPALALISGVLNPSAKIAHAASREKQFTDASIHHRFVAFALPSWTDEGNPQAPHHFAPWRSWPTSSAMGSYM
jgi:hypothetical protein